MKAIDAVYFQEFINIYKTSQKEQANRGLGLQYFGPEEMQMLIDKIPIIEAEPVRHGRWIEIRDKYNYCIGQKCSECGRRVRNCGENYCPSCGAKMDLKE